MILIGFTGAPAVPVDGRALDATAASTASGRAGAIAYMGKDPNDLWQVWTICPDMTRKAELTAGASSRNGWPTWSPDGSRIAFNTDRDTPGGSPSTDSGIWDIYTMGADGADLVKLTDTIGLAGDPAYSRDGQLIAFGWDPPGAAGLYVMDAQDGSAKRRVTELPPDAAVDFAPRFSPDGDRLVFTRDHGDAGSALFVVDLDGTDLARITPPSSRPTEADWSPDGTQLVFDDPSTTPTLGGPWVIGPDGQGLRHVTEPSTDPDRWDGFSHPVWSADGTLILTLHGIHTTGRSVTAGLATMLPDGTDIRYLGDGRGGEIQAQWGAAGAC